MTGSEPGKQHLISKVLLRRFTGMSGQLRSFDLLHGRSYLRHPAQVAWRKDFIEQESAKMEALWQQMETRLSAALDAVEGAMALELPDVAETLRRTIALHFMRRELVKDSFEKSFASARAGVTAPADYPGDHDVFRRAVRSRLDSDRAVTFAENVRSLFDKAKALADHSHLEVFHSAAPLLIGDGAVLSIRRDGGVGFVQFSEAATHLLPAGRNHLIALAKDDQMTELPEDLAHQLNEQQIVNARSRVYFHPEDDLESFVHHVRDRHRATAQASTERR